jgi:hypothetical protein
VASIEKKKLNNCIELLNNRTEKLKLVVGDLMSPVSVSYSNRKAWMTNKLIDGNKPLFQLFIRNLLKQRKIKS